MSKPQDGLQGTLDMLILKAISLQPTHGYGVLLRIQQLSKDRLQIQQGSLYPALYRLQHRGWITAKWGESDNGRKAKFYRLTEEGRQQLQAETENWNRLKAGIVGVMNALPEEGS
jgi:PadR family transcriptional regulator PadR